MMHYIRQAFRLILLHFKHTYILYKEIMKLAHFDIYIYIMDENDPLTEYKKIPLGHHRTNGAVYSKINFKVEICSALYIFDSHPRFISRDNTAQS